jgi:O-succinylbenzoate synthase
MVKKLQRAVGGKATLRLDVNRRWSVEDTLVFTEQVTGDTIEYLEEPVGSVDELRQLIDHKVKVALDESLMELPTGKLNEFLSSGSVAALVIKPTMLGLNKALELAKLANSYDVCAVISSSFESALGLTMLANMASAVNKTNIPAGLDTWRYFKKDLFDLPVSNSGDSFNLKSSMHPLVDIDLLKEITIV